MPVRAGLKVRLRLCSLHLHSWAGLCFLEVNHPSMTKAWVRAGTSTQFSQAKYSTPAPECAGSQGGIAPALDFFMRWCLCCKLVNVLRKANYCSVAVCAEEQSPCYAHLGVGLQVVLKDVHRDSQVTVVEGVGPVPALGPKSAPLGHCCMEVAKCKQDAPELCVFAALLQCFLQRNSEAGLQLLSDAPLVKNIHRQKRTESVN